MVAQRTMFQDRLATSEINVALNLIAIYKALGGDWQVKTNPKLASSQEPFIKQSSRKGLNMKAGFNAKQEGHLLFNEFS